MEEVEVGGRTHAGDAVAPNGCWRSTEVVHLGRGPGGRGTGSGGADLSGPPASLSAHCLPAALWLDLLTSACWILAPACCWLAAPSLPAAPTRWLHGGSEVGGLQPLPSWDGRGSESCRQSGPTRQGGTRETVG